MRRWCALLVLAFAIVLESVTVSAQTTASEPFDPGAFRVGERLWVTTESVHQGTLVEARTDALVLETRDGRRVYPVQDIERVQRRRNGTVLGTAVGAGIGLAGGLALASLLANEGGNGALPALGLTAAGAAGGYLVDAALGSYLVVYERPGTVRLDTVSHRLRASAEFGPAFSAFAGEDDDGSTRGVSLLANVAGSPVWAGVAVYTVRAHLMDMRGIGPLAQVDLGRRTRTVVPYVSGGVLFGDWGRWGLAGGGAHLRLATRAALKIGGQYTFHKEERLTIGTIDRTKGTSRDLGLLVGFVYR